MSNNNQKLISRLYSSYVRGHLKVIIIAIICMVIVASTTAAHAWLMQPVIDDIFVSKDTSLLKIIAIAIFATALLKGVATYFQATLMARTQSKIASEMQLTLFDKIIKSDLAVIHSEKTGGLISRFSNDIGLVSGQLIGVSIGFIREFITLLALVVLMFVQSWQLSLMVFFVFPLAVYPIRKVGRRMRKLSSSAQQMLGSLTGRLQDSLHTIKVVKSHNNEDYEIAKTRNHVMNLLRVAIKSIRTGALISPLMEMLGGIAIGVVVIYGGHQVIGGEYTSGQFFSFITALLMAYKPLKSVGNINNAIQTGYAALIRFYGFCDTKNKIEDGKNAIGNDETQLAIKFDDVAFSYGNDIKALEGVSLLAEAGKITALVGESGGGKSTIINMILRFYDADSGNILIGNHNIKDVSLSSLRNKIAFVNQEATLFDDTIRNNIAYGIDASDEDIIQAAKQANADEFINALENGYDTQVGQMGGSLSGGQRQRIAIARAILKNADILLLDEATSALDNISEQKIQQALSRLMQGKTVIIIAHRLSTVIGADKICVINNGKVVETGNHAELIALKGAYTKLYNKEFE